MDETEPSEPQRGALAGVRVVEFAQNMAVPSCGRVLAAMGAEVVKVEPPSGDASRSMAPFAGLTEGRGYALTNPGKRSVVLDLAHPGAGAVRDALVRSADVVLCAFKATDLARYGLTYERLVEVHPTMVYLEHLPFGPEGPDAASGGYDVLVQGLSGLSFVTSRSDGDRPMAVRPAYSDMATGLASAAAVLAALYHRARTGEGQRVRTSLLGTAHWLALPINARFDDHDTELLAEFRDDLTAARTAGLSFDEQRAIYESRVLPGNGAFDIWFRHYRTSDGLVSVGALSPGLIDRFHAATGLPDPRREGWAYRSAPWQRMVADAEALFLTDTTDGWVARLRAAGVPSSRYHTPIEAIDDPGAVANGFVEDLDHPVLGRYRTTSAPIAMDRTPVRTPGPSPALGADTDDVLASLGLDAEALAHLRAEGIIDPA